MSLLEPLLLIVGLGTILIAYGMYVRRTQDIRGVMMFWSRRLALSRTEFRLQRAGVVILLLGIVLRYLTLLQLL